MKSNDSGLSKISDHVVEFVLTCEVKEFENLTVNAIARKFNINRCYLSQRFKYDKKVSLHGYILMIKILRSISLLEAEENITVEDLSQRMGFSSPDYFTRVFKKMIGTTPGRYKNCLKKTKTIKNV
ncbi:MAG: helix-turn-helix transcriptional regulator [Candidatus Aminicenantes bacterium]|nr:MAG: helix-turn-helix transcriptional regulator [Candidatus Aminicenantes bacterium]